jgi:DNA-binding transcriptional LysR family regulator
MLRCRSAKVQNGPMLDWNDVRYFLAVADTGSTLAAGRVLRVSQTTVARRITALEAALGLTLFERRPAGYALTPSGEALIERARGVATAAEGLAEAASVQTREASGIVRVTMEEIYAVTVMGPILRDLHDRHPAIRIELDTTEDVRDLAAGAAEVAIRTTKALTGGGLVGRRVATTEWTIYCSRVYAAEHGVPRTRRALRGHPIIGGGGRNIWRVYLEWLRENGLEDAIAIQHDSVAGLLAAVRSGIGLAALPSFVADLDPDLVCCLPPAPDKHYDLWLLTAERLRHSPRVRIVLDFLAERLARLAREGADRRAEMIEVGGALIPAFPAPHA